jgi:hypothetical protein
MVGASDGVNIGTTPGLQANCSRFAATSQDKKKGERGAKFWAKKSPVTRTGLFLFTY